MATTTTLETGDKVENLTVVIERVTSFWRYNRYNRRQELKYTISMSGCDAEPDEPWYVTFTSGAFSKVAEGDRVTITPTKIEGAAR